nr:type III secretion system gatekeeper subunit SctW [Burkholderia ubonensis]
MSMVSGPTSAARLTSIRDQSERGARLDAEPSLDADTQVQTQPVDIQAQMAEVEDDAGSMLAQFGRFRASSRSSRRSEDLERILDTDADEKTDELHTLLKDGKPKAPELLREGRQRFRDESDLMLALRELRRRKKLDGEPVDVVEKAMDELLTQGDGKQIKAGINAALKAKVFGKRMQLDPGRLRQLYRQFLVFEGSHLMVYEDWIEQFGSPKRKRIIDYVGAALTYDMQSLDPSCSCAAEFGPLLGTLGNVRLLSSADEVFVGRILDDDLAAAFQLDEDSVLQLMLGALQRPLAIGEVITERIGAVLRVLPSAQRCELMQLVLRAFVNVPITLYGEPDERHALIATIQNMMSLLYADERRRARMTRHSS